MAKTILPAGIFLDKLGHHLTEGAIAFALGLRIANWPDEALTSTNYPMIGALFAALVILNKALNDAVHVSRYFAGLPKLEDRKSASHSRSFTHSFCEEYFSIHSSPSNVSFR